MVQTATPHNSVPTIKISARGAERLQSGHVWVYRSDVVSDEGAQPGAVIAVTDPRGKMLGTAFYSSSSQIAIRLISRDPVKDFEALLRERIAAAVAYRESVVRETNAYRLIFSEADFLPGLVVDRYDDIVSVQILTQAMDANLVRETLISELNQRVNPAAIVERVDARVRELEALPSRASGILQGAKTSTTIHMNSVRFQYEGL